MLLVKIKKVVLHRHQGKGGENPFFGAASIYLENALLQFFCTNAKHGLFLK